MPVMSCASAAGICGSAVFTLDVPPPGRRTDSRGVPKAADTALRGAADREQVAARGGGAHPQSLRAQARRSPAPPQPRSDRRRRRTAPMSDSGGTPVSRVWRPLLPRRPTRSGPVRPTRRRAAASGRPAPARGGSRRTGPSAARPATSPLTAASARPRRGPRRSGPCRPPGTVPQRTRRPCGLLSSSACLSIVIRLARSFSAVGRRLVIHMPFQRLWTILLRHDPRRVSVRIDVTLAVAQ